MPEQAAGDTPVSELVAWLETIADDDRTTFLVSARDYARRVGTLSERQAVVVARIRAERAGDLRERGPGVREAGVDDCREILNGVYTINDGSEHLTFRIHTVQRGSLQGKRIVKRQTVYGEFEGFAFLTTEGTLQVWRRFAEASANGERYIVWARLLLKALKENPVWASHSLRFATEPTLTVRPGHPEDRYDTALTVQTYEVQRSTLCRACNRPLTTPSSLDAGLGPECASRAADRTTAAAPHATIGVDGTVTANVAGFAQAAQGAAEAVTGFADALRGAGAATARPRVAPRTPRAPRTPAAPRSNVRMSEIDSTWEQ